MLAFERVSRLFVVERFRIPLDEREVLAVVLGVAAAAVLARSRRKMIGGVQALAFRQALGDFSVAIQAFECCLS